MQASPLPAPSDLGRYYEHDYRTILGGTEVADVRRFPRDNLYYYNRGQSVADAIAPLIPMEAPAILDVGAGWGHILYGLRERLPHARLMATESGRVCVPHLRSLGVTVFTRPAEEVLPEFESELDLVVMSHVLEHLLEPALVLPQVHAALAPGGLLWVEVPNIPADALLQHLDHRWAPRFDEPHVTFFSESTLARTLAAAGFTPQRIWTAGPLYRPVSALRFTLPPARETVEKLIPRPVFDFLRRLPVTASVRVSDREPSFYEEGGRRIWIRSLWRKDPGWSDKITSQ